MISHLCFHHSDLLCLLCHALHKYSLKPEAAQDHGEPQISRSTHVPALTLFWRMRGCGLTWNARASLLQDFDAGSTSSFNLSEAGQPGHAGRLRTHDSVASAAPSGRWPMATPLSLTAACSIMALLHRPRIACQHIRVYIPCSLLPREHPEGAFYSSSTASSPEPLEDVFNC